MQSNFRFLLILGVCFGLVACQSDESRLEHSDNAPSLDAPESGPKLPDFAAISDVSTKKQRFFEFLEPMIEAENRHIDDLRQHLASLQQLLQTQTQLHPDDQAWLNQAAELYRADATDPAQQLETLLAKVDRIPAALVKAQAANESAWGTSRFARQANNLFGQWCFKPGCGIAPLQRGAGETHEVQAFDSVAAGLRSYFTNLNGNQSYADLRQIRRCLSQAQQPVQGRALAAGLVNYSARGPHYVEELQAMIRVNQLESWDSNWWGNSQPKHACFDLVQVEIDRPDPVVVVEAVSNATSSASASVASTGQETAPASVATDSITASNAVEPLAETAEPDSDPAIAAE